MQVTTDQKKSNKRHEAVIPYIRGTRNNKPIGSKPYLRSLMPQWNGVQPWDRVQVFRSVCRSRAVGKCPGNRAGRRFSALGIVREQRCPSRSVTLQVRNEPATRKNSEDGTPE